MPGLCTEKLRSILVADDHAVVRRGLKQVIADEYDDVLVEEVGTGQGALDAVRRHEWDAVLLDINLPDKNGLDVLKEIKAVRPALIVLILSQHGEEQYAARAYKAGAAGYLTKESAAEELAAAIRKVLSGGRYVSRSFAERLAGHLSGETGAEPHEILSDREHLVLCRIASGETVSQIADELALSVKTISTYRARLLEKLQLANNAELMRYAIDRRLVE
jgi:two-component system, NarL family, invasion response regulator UvrY